MHEYYGGRISIGIIVGIEHSTEAIWSPRCYTVYIDDDFDRWGEWFLHNRIVSAASPQGLDRVQEDQLSSKALVLRAAPVRNHLQLLRTRLSSEP